MAKKNSSDVIFLGLCDRVAQDQSIGSWNVLGLGYNLFSPIFPTHIAQIYFGFSFPGDSLMHEYNFEITNSKGKLLGNLAIKSSPHPHSEADREPKQNEHLIKSSKGNRLNCFISFGNNELLFEEPGEYTLKLIKNNKKIKIGSFSFYATITPALTEDRKIAIRSDPSSAKSVSLELGCKHCTSKCKSYVSLERNDQKHADCTWYEDLPDLFICNCKKTEIGLQYIRKNMHFYLGKNFLGSKILDFTPSYELSSLRLLRRKFLYLLNSSPREEALQSFIHKNPILFHQFAGQLIIPKPPILSKYFADFCILTAQKELIFVEIEKTTTQIMKKNGHRAQGLNHAFEQVRDWLHLTDNHKYTLLTNLNIPSESVLSIHGLVIAGRESGYDAQNLRRLKAAKDDRIKFLTYDDLLFSLDALTDKFSTM